MRRFLTLIMALVMALALAACGEEKQAEKKEAAPAAEKAAEAPAKEPLKVGFIYISPVGDAGYSYAHDLGRKMVSDMPGVETSFVESVPEGPDSERVILNMARKDYKLIFATSFGYMDPVIKVAKDFPTRFSCIAPVSRPRPMPDLLRPHVSGPLSHGHRGRRHDQVQEARLCGRLPHSRSHPRHQRLHPGRAEREPGRGSARGLDQDMVRPGHGKRSRQEPA